MNRFRDLQAVKKENLTLMSLEFLEGQKNEGVKKYAKRKG